MKKRNFSPDNNINTNAQIFGLDNSPEDSRLILIPAPWDATATGRKGTANAPASIFDVSFHIDLFDKQFPESWRQGIAMLDIPEDWIQQNKRLQKKIQCYYDYKYHKPDTRTLRKLKQYRKDLHLINQQGALLNKWIKNKASTYLQQNKKVGLIGGEHSTPLGLLQALAKHHAGFGILHIDAHADLRKAYLGLQYSHASIMYNALQIKEIKKLVQVGVRDYCFEEHNCILENPGKIMLFDQHSLSEKLFTGTTWQEICTDIIRQLPDKVYVSFDFDGLSLPYSSSTGTPVPGGPDYDQIIFLLEMLNEYKKDVIGFDLCELIPDENNVSAVAAAKLLYKLSLVTLAT